jgi:uncharacterized cupredoxin-like copper-binding protein
MRWLRTGAACSVVVSALGVAPLAACGGGGDNTVDVTLKDFSIAPEETTLDAGKVTFKVHNEGSFVHELVVTQGSNAGALPTKSSGEVNEDDIPEAKHVGEVEDIDPGASKEVALDLAAGSYVLFCNRVDGTTSHFAKGMHTVVTVTPPG